MAGAGHRRNPNRRGFVPAGWLIASGLIACLAAAAWLVVDLTGVTDDTAAAPAPTPSATATTESPEPTQTVPPVEETPDEPEAVREASVAVFNNTTVANLAATFGQRVTDAGWTLDAVGNWNGQIPENTVYYPADLEDQGRLLADDLEITRVLPAVENMRPDRLTIVLSGPQQ